MHASFTQKHLAGSSNWNIESKTHYFERIKNNGTSHYRFKTQMNQNIQFKAPSVDLKTHVLNFKNLSSRQQKNGNDLTENDLQQIGNDLTDRPQREVIRVNVHYSRQANDYEGWNLWYWKTGEAGKTAQFEGKDTFGKFTTIEIPKEDDAVEFILRKNDWHERDVHFNRKFSLANAKNKLEMDVFLRQNDPNVYFNITEIPRTKRFETYQGDDLGVSFQKDKIAFRVWSPVVDKAELLIYDQGTEGNPSNVIPMEYSKGGTWKAELPKEVEGKYYTFRVDGREAVDPYAKGVGINGHRGHIIDLSKTNPKDWDRDKRPMLKNATDAIIYELHVRNYSIDQSSGVSNEKKGKYLGLIQNHTKSPDGLATGIDHLKELGVTHVQLLPAYDFASVDETRHDGNNWGYDPLNWNTPEGSYASNAHQGNVRVKEFKEMVKGFHDHGIRVIMDVVYPHTYKREDSNLNLLMPDYYYRKTPEGHYANGSGCGNEIASEREMVRKLIVDSVVYWAKEYHIDGFRFDQMSLLDKDTLIAIRNELNKLDPNILMYGEAWDRSHTLPEGKSAGRNNSAVMRGIGFFNNEFSASIRGDFNGNGEQGIIQGNDWKAERVVYGLKADAHPATEPRQMINYVACHDNLSLWDNLNKTLHEPFEQKIRAYKLGYATTLVSQGIPFLSEGEEFTRNKNGNHNTYNAGDGINKIDWRNKSWHRDVNDYIRGMIALRKEHPAFRIPNNHEILDKTQCVNDATKKIIQYTINNHANHDPIRKFETIINYGANEQWVHLSENNRWVVLVNEQKAGVKEVGKVDGDWVKVPARSMLVLADAESYKRKEAEKVSTKMLHYGKCSKNTMQMEK